MQMQARGNSGDRSTSRTKTWVPTVKIASRIRILNASVVHSKPHVMTKEEICREQMLDRNFGYIDLGYVNGGCLW